MDLDELKKLVEERVERVDSEIVFFSLKELRIRRITKQAVELLRLLVVFDELGLPITTESVSWFRDTVNASILSQLHVLGDKKVLIFTKGSSKDRMFRWLLEPRFRDLVRSRIK